MLFGLLLIKIHISHCLVVSVILDCRCVCTVWTMRAYASAVFIPYEFCSIKFAPWFQTAGIGVFAGRDFKKGEIVLRSSMTLVLPGNIPGLQILRHYSFGHNKTHIVLDLDYGSIINHHESANAEAILLNNKYYRVRGFLLCESQCSKDIVHTYIHAYIYIYIYISHARIHNRYTYPHSRLQKTSRLGRKFLFSMAIHSGLNVKTYRA